MAKIDQVAKDVLIIKEHLVEKVPGHFGAEHIVTAFFGALFFGFTFVLKGLLFNVGLQLRTAELLLITFLTLIILTAEIYFVGYWRVPDKYRRKFGQFWTKRIISYYFIAIFTSFIILSAYGISSMAGSTFNVVKLVIAVSFPAAIGAGASDLLSKY